jgi:uncharacterized Zn-binding protein involved in type VI secretion
MPFAARVNDLTAPAHPGSIGGPGVPTVLIGGRPAAVVGDVFICALPPTAGPHPPTPFPPTTGSKTVFIGGRGALRVGDISSCGAPIVTGAPNVLIG